MASRCARAAAIEAGFVEGENVAVEYRWADNQIDRLQTLAAELVRRQVTLIVAGGGFRSALAAKTETKSIPVLFVAGEDPVKLGLVTSLAKPDGNLTGINILVAEVVTKRLELLRDLLPKAVRIDVLVDPISSTTAKIATGVRMNWLAVRCLLRQSRCLAKNSRMRPAISSFFSSKAKWPASSR